MSTDEQPITIDNLKDALVAIDLSDREKRALVALWQLPDSSGTPPEVATQADFTHFVEANDCIGAIGNKLAKYLGELKPNQEGPGYSFIAESDWQDGHFVWYLHEDICLAIEELGWAGPLLPPEVKKYQEGEISLITLKPECFTSSGRHVGGNAKNNERVAKHRTTIVRPLSIKVVECT